MNGEIFKSQKKLSPLLQRWCSGVAELAYASIWEFAPEDILGYVRICWDMIGYDRIC
jgi:hypothetical protein